MQLSTHQTYKVIGCILWREAVAELSFNHCGELLWIVVTESLMTHFSLLTGAGDPCWLWMTQTT